MASDADVREQLLQLDFLLVEAYGDGPRQLELFAQRWSSLAATISAGVHAKTLSDNTLSLARTVTQKIAKVASAFARLEQTANDTSLPQSLPIADAIKEQEASIKDEVTSESDLDELDEEDAEEDDGDDDPNLPNMEALRDWILANMGYPFIPDNWDCSQLAQSTNMSRPQLQQWVDFIRQRSGWHTYYSLHANSKKDKMCKFWSIFSGEIQRGVPPSLSELPLRVRRDFTKIRNLVIRIFESGMSPWWENATKLFLNAWTTPRDVAIQVEEWSSDEDSDNESQISCDDGILAILEGQIASIDFDPLDLNSADEVDLDIDTPNTASDSVFSPISTVPTPSDLSPSQVSVVSGIKRKLEEVLLSETYESQSFEQSEKSLQSCKRRKIDSSSSPVTPLSNPSLSPSASSPAYSSAASSRASSSASSTPSAADSPSSPISSPITPFKKLKSSQSPPAIHFIPINLVKQEVIEPASAKLLEEQVKPDPEIPIHSIRSSLNYHGRKRKRSPAQSEYSIRDSKISSEQAPCLLKPLDSPDTHRTNTSPQHDTYLHSSPTLNQVQIPPFKRKRLNESSISNSSATWSNHQRQDSKVNRSSSSPNLSLSMTGSKLSPLPRLTPFSSPRPSKASLKHTGPSSANCESRKSRVQPSVSAHQEQKATSLYSHSASTQSGKGPVETSTVLSGYVGYGRLEESITTPKLVSWSAYLGSSISSVEVQTLSFNYDSSGMERKSPHTYDPSSALAYNENAGNG